MRRRARHIVPLLLALAAWLPSQPLPRDSSTARAPGTMLSSAFERNVNTYSWDLQGRTMLRTGAWSVSAVERYQRTLIRTDRTSVKDDQNLRIDISRRVASSLDVLASASSFLFSDNRALGLNDISTSKALAGLSWRPLEWLTLTPLAGAVLDVQQGVEDRGWTYAGTLQMRDLRIGDSQASGELFATKEFLAPRVQREERVAGELLSAFGRARNRAAALAKMLNRDFYLAFDSALQRVTGDGHPIESRAEQTVSLSDDLQYDLTDAVALLVAVDAAQRSIGKGRRNVLETPDLPNFHTEIEEFRLSGLAGLRYADAGTTGEMRLEVNERSERHRITRRDDVDAVALLRQERLESQKDNAILQTQLSLALTHPASDRDTLSFSGSTVKLVYNTQSPANSDDRDELFLLGGIRWLHRFSPWLLASLSGQVNLRHTVYIFAERSANNAWNRVFRITPATELRIGPRIHSKNIADVTANYTVYDYEQAGTGQRSFSLRQMTLIDSTTVSLGRAASAFVQALYRVYEQGEIRWTAFTVRPQSFVDERSLAIGMTGEGEEWFASAGLRIFQQIRYAYRGAERRRQSELLSYGPMCRARWRVGGAADITADGWYQWTSQGGAETRSTPNLSLSIVWNL